MNDPLIIGLEASLGEPLQGGGHLIVSTNRLCELLQNP